MAIDNGKNDKNDMETVSNFPIQGKITKSLKSETGEK